MKTEKNILIAFLLNFFFSLFELIGGYIIGSVAITSDAVHDMGDAASIGLSYFLEKKSKNEPDEKYTYGYGRYSVFGSLTVTLMLLCGAVMMVYSSIHRILHPSEIDYDGMILFALVGVSVNFCAAYFTRDKHSIHQKAVNLHMLEDVLGWAVVLVGAIVMRLTDFALIDPILSIAVSIFIFINAAKNLKETAAVFLEKAPNETNATDIAEHLKIITGVLDVHHVHLWSIDGQSHHATMHVVTDGDPKTVKRAIREELIHHGITHVTLEIESPDEYCHEKICKNEPISHHHCHHGHHAH